MDYMHHNIYTFVSEGNSQHKTQLTSAPHKMGNLERGRSQSN